jgi:hypothetical protein
MVPIDSHPPAAPASAAPLASNGVFALLAAPALDPSCRHREHRYQRRRLPRRARRGTSARARPRKADAARRRPRPGNGGEPQAGKDRKLERLRTGLRQEQERRTSASPDPPRDAGNLFAASRRRTRVEVATRQAIQVAPDGSAGPRSGSVLNPRISAVVGAGGLVFAKWVGKSIGLRD